jgi:hypothetical protein
MKTPRKIKKCSALKTGILVMDLKSVPKYMDLAQLNYLIHLTGIAIWDSSLGGEAPKLIGRKYKRFKIVDTSKDNPNFIEV